MSKVLLIFISILASSLASAAKTEDSLELSEISLGIERTLYVDAYLFSGYSQIDHPSLSSSPQGSQLGAGLTLGAKITSFMFFALTGEYRMLNQFSEVNESNPNFTGQRLLPIAPVLGFKFDKYILKIDYQTLGDLEFTKAFPEGGRLKLSNPHGYRATFLFDQFLKMPWGIYYESLNFKKRIFSEAGEMALSSDFSVWQLGLMLTLIM